MSFSALTLCFCAGSCSAADDLAALGSRDIMHNLTHTFHRLCMLIRSMPVMGVLDLLAAAWLKTS